MATYRVKETDNLYSLSKKLGVSITELKQANGIENLTAGQTLRVPVQRDKGQAGYYQTGENERKTVTINGQEVRIPPNTTVTPNAPPKNKFQQFFDVITGNTRTQPSGQTASVGGSLAGVPLQNPDGSPYSPQQLYQIGTTNTNPATTRNQTPGISIPTLL